MRVLELFAGIGGCAVVAHDRPGWTIVAAIDQDEAAARSYAHLHGDAPLRRNLHHVKPEWFRRFEADLWWMSPPCQPYTIRGKRRDLDDPRSHAFQRVVAAIDVLRPAAVAMENVPWFEGSRSEALLLEVLQRHRYAVVRQVLCPTELGVPAQRRRYYLVASQAALSSESPAPAASAVSVADWLDPFDAEYAVPESLARRYDGALHVVDADDPAAVTVCFTGAYGRSPVYAGSYVRQGGRLRWLKPVEIARSLGFPSSFSLPNGITREKAYKLVGNSLSIHAVRHVLAGLESTRAG